MTKLILGGVGLLFCLALAMVVVSEERDKREPTTGSASQDKAEKTPKESSKKEVRPASTGGIAASDPEKTGIIEGVVRFVGKTIPEYPVIKVKPDHKDVKCCGLEIPSERLVLDADKHIANVVISLADTKALPRAKSRDVRLSNEKCMFKPHVVAVPLRSNLLIDSKDEGVAHNAHGLIGPGFNVFIPQPGRDVPIRMRQAGYTLLKCDLHTWMMGHIWTFPHDFFAVTGGDGKFRLEGVPPGEYTLDIWHETLVGITKKPIQKKITVKAKETARVDVDLEPRAKPKPKGKAAAAKGK